MKNLSLVAAIGKNNELGLDNQLIWKIKEDLMFYKNLTIHQNVIMGRKTFESMPSKAIEQREIFVLTSMDLDKHTDVNTYHNVEDLISYIKDNPNKNFILAGGSQIYSLLLPYVDTMYLTEIESYANADTFFPEIDIDTWDVETIYENHKYDYQNENNVPYVRNRYVRKKVK